MFKGNRRDVKIGDIVEWENISLSGTKKILFYKITNIKECDSNAAIPGAIQIGELELWGSDDYSTLEEAKNSNENGISFLGIDSKSIIKIHNQMPSIQINGEEYV